jgi:hypothetical protein
MPQITTGAVQCPTITSLTQVRAFEFKHLSFTLFTFSGGPKSNTLKYRCVSDTRGMIGVYVMKDIFSNRVFHLGSSKRNLYEQIALVVQKYKISSGKNAVAFVEVAPTLIEKVIERIKLTHKSELIDDTFFKLMPRVLKEQTIPTKLLTFFSLYNESAVSPQPLVRIKSNIAHLGGRKGVYVIQIAKKGEESN